MRQTKKGKDMDYQDLPSAWLETHYDEYVYDTLDEMFWRGELNQMDAGDVVHLAIELQNGSNDDE